MKNKHLGSSFDDHLIEDLKESDELVFLHIKEALETPNLHSKNDCEYLMQAIKDVATARGKVGIAEKAGISRQSLHKILNGQSIPSIHNVMAILTAIGLQFSVQQAKKVIGDETPANVLDVAEYINNRLSRSSTVMKLQKLVYYSQVEFLRKYKKPLFCEKIEAWAAGPVVRELFNKHKGKKYTTNLTFGDQNNLSIEQQSCINWAIERFGNLDGDTLSHLTHVEDPWKNARSGLDSGDNCDKEITITSLIDYYSNLPDYNELDDNEMNI